MKRHFFSFMAMAMCAFAMISCNKDDDNAIQSDEKYLTLEEQQAICSQAVAQVAQAIDFSNLYPVTDLISGLKAAGYSKILTSDAVEFLEGNGVLTEFVNFYNSLVKGTSKNLDLSPLYVKVDIATRDSIMDDTILCLYPYVTSIQKNDCIELNVDVKGHKLTVKVKSSEGSSKIEGTLNGYPIEGMPVAPKHTEFIVPNELSLSILFDQKALLGLSLNSDTDLKFVESEFISEEDGEIDSSFDVDFSKLTLGLTGQISDVSITVNGTCNDNNALLSFQTLLDKTPLSSGSLELDASMSELLADLSKSSVMAWAMNYEKLRSLSMNSSFMGDKTSHNFKLMNPMKDPKMVTYFINLQNAKEITPEMSKQIIDALAPFITSDFFFAGYDKPQASLELQYDSKMNLTALVSEYSKSLGNLPVIGSYVYSIARNLTAVTQLADQAGIAPVVRIHAANAADEKVVGINQYLEKVDLASAVSVIKEKLMAVIDNLLDAFIK